ncbi:MAG: hypothetical protein RR880_06050, partial [Bacteroidales bacterium]
KALEINCNELVFDEENNKPDYSLAAQEREELISTIETLKKYIATLEQLIALQKEKLDNIR